MSVTISSGSNSALGKGCATIFLSVFALAGFAVLFFIGKAGWETIRSYSWTRTDCVIESSAMKETGDGAEFVVRYSYRFDGRNYTGTRDAIGISNSANADSVQRAVQRYPKGAAAVCFVNPSSPGESALRRGVLWPLVFGLIPLVFIAVGVGGIIAVWRAKPAAAIAVSERFRGGKGGVLGMRIFGSVFILIGGAAMYAMLIHPMLREFVAAKWPQVPCEILSSKVGQHHGSKGGYTYSVDVRYRYTVGGTERIGTSYNFDTGTSSSLGWRSAAVTALPVGKMTVCYVNPEDPLDAVLSVTGSPDRWFGLIPGLFVIVGLFIFFKAPVAGRRSSVVPTGVTAAASVLSSLRQDDASGTGGEVELKQSSPPGCAFAVIVFAALFWNGITWGILLATRPGDWGPRIFLGVFALIGFGLLCAAFHQFLALFNPRPVLTVSTPAVPLGGRLGVRWRFTGNVRRIVKLTIALVAREEATYRRGTDTTTDRNVFVNTVLLDSADRAQFSEGSVSVEIPRDSIHTFTAPNNKIVWLLRVQGEIPRWPDVNAEFPFTVLPCDAATLFREPPSAP
jgi:hypothetical protein